MCSWGRRRWRRLLAGLGEQLVGIERVQSVVAAEPPTRSAWAMRKASSRGRADPGCPCSRRGRRAPARSAPPGANRLTRRWVGPPARHFLPGESRHGLAAPLSARGPPPPVRRRLRGTWAPPMAALEACRVPGVTAYLGSSHGRPRRQRDVLEAAVPGRHCCPGLRVSNWSYVVTSGTGRVPAGSGGSSAVRSRDRYTVGRLTLNRAAIWAML